jgi:hypothetical protein
MLPVPLAVMVAELVAFSEVRIAPPSACKENPFPVDEPKVTPLPSTRVTLLVVLADKDVAVVTALIAPAPEINVTVGLMMDVASAPPGPVIRPIPSAFRVAEVVAIKLSSRMIEPIEPLLVVNASEPVVTTPVVVMPPFAVKANALPDEAPSETVPESLIVTFPAVLAVSVPAFV